MTKHFCDKCSAELSAECARLFMMRGQPSGMKYGDVAVTLDKFALNVEICEKCAESFEYWWNGTMPHDATCICEKCMGPNPFPESFSTCSGCMTSSHCEGFKRCLAECQPSDLNIFHIQPTPWRRSEYNPETFGKVPCSSFRPIKHAGHFTMDACVECGCSEVMHGQQKS